MNVINCYVRLDQKSSEPVFEKTRKLWYFNWCNMWCCSTRCVNFLIEIICQNLSYRICTICAISKYVSNISGLLSAPKCLKILRRSVEKKNYGANNHYLIIGIFRTCWAPIWAVWNYVGIRVSSCPSEKICVTRLTNIF